MIHYKSIFLFLEEVGIHYRYNGITDGYINGFCAVSHLKPESITWIRNSNDFDVSTINVDLNILIVTNFSIDEQSKIKKYNVIECEDPRKTYFEIVNYFFVSPKESRIESDSVIETEHIGKNVSIGHHCYICKEVTIGDNVVIKNHVIIECPVEIGENTIIWSGVIIGTDGYGYYQKEDGINYKISHFGGVSIGKNVEIGANTCIDRGTLADTIIGDNVKIDNLCHIAHNVHLENNVMITGHVALSGSIIIQEGTYIAPGAVISNRITIGKDSFIGLGAVVNKDVPDSTLIVGVPAKTMGNKERYPLPW